MALNSPPLVRFAVISTPAVPHHRGHHEQARSQRRTSFLCAHVRTLVISSRGGDAGGGPGWASQRHQLQRRKRRLRIDRRSRRGGGRRRHDVVCPGTAPYDEQVVINKALTVKGFAKTNVVIRPTSAVANTSSLYSGAPIVAVIVVMDTTATLTNLVADGGGTELGVDCSAPNFVGIFYRNASGTISNSTARNLRLAAGLGCHGLTGVRRRTGEWQRSEWHPAWFWRPRVDYRQSDHRPDLLSVHVPIRAGRGGVTPVRRWECSSSIRETECSSAATPSATRREPFTSAAAQAPRVGISFQTRSLPRRCSTGLPLSVVPPTP